VEAAVALHEQVKDRLDDIQLVEIQTQQSGDRIINKTGPLNNPADRDHCIQYMVGIALIFGRLTAEDYEDDVACDPRIDMIRERMTCVTNDRFTREYREADKRAIGNSVQVFFQDGSSTESVAIDYPVGHRRRRDEGLPLLEQKFERFLRGSVPTQNAERILELCSQQTSFEDSSVDEMMSLLATPS
jgi:2-methylcitrate dehydratase PrpD